MSLLPPFLMKNVCNPTFTNANYLMSCQNREVLDFISVIVSVYEVCCNVNYGILEYCVAMSKIEIVSVVSFFCTNKKTVKPAVLTLA